MKYSIKTTIQIEASKEIVWSILTDFKQYPKWNPFINSIEGELREGNSIRVSIDGMNFTPLVLSMDKQNELRWRGKLFIKGLFDGEHSFLLHQNEDGSTTFEQNEYFSGILVGPFKKRLERETLPGFQKMNQKLKEMAEQISKG